MMSQDPRTVERVLIAVAVVSLLTGSAFSHPREWSDDFTTETTYYSRSLLAPCYSTGAPSTKYTLFDANSGDISSMRGVSGQGKLMVSNTALHREKPFPRLNFAILGLVMVEQTCPDVANMVYGETTEPFTSPKICIYGGFEFNPWQLKSEGVDGEVNDPFGADGEPGEKGCG